MNDVSLEARYRVFLLYVTGLTLAAAMLELWFSEHTEGFVQVLPFGLAAAGLIATVAVLAKTNRRTIRTLQAVSTILGLGALYGMYEHLSHNLAFEMEIRPTVSAGEALAQAIYGASPLLAPGVLALAALLAAAAVYRHPALKT